MNRIAALTVIRGNGGCEAYWNGIVNEEMRKLNERHALEMSKKNAELEAARGHRDDLLRDRLTDYEYLYERPTTAFERLLERLATLWCQFWGICLELKLVESVNDKER